MSFRFAEIRIRSRQSGDGFVRESSQQTMTAMPNPPLARLGLDTYSLRAQNWDAFQQLDYCAARGVKVVHFSEPRLVGGFDRTHLERVRAHADSRGLDIEIGMLSICPTS